MFIHLAATPVGSTKGAASSRMGIRVVKRGLVCVVLVDAKQSAPEKQGYDC